MSPTLTVETSDLAAAAHQLSDEVGMPLWSAVGGALSEAESCTGMAGNDPAGLSWAAAYEPAAMRSAHAAQDVINGAFRLSQLLGATADNYARADAAATIGERHAVDTVIMNLPGPTEVTLDTRFSGVSGGPPNAPLGWSHVEHVVGAVWPNGHQDRLRRAAAAWRRSAGALDARAEDVDLALIDPLEDGLPEWRDIRTACWSLAGQLRTVAHAHRSLASSCEQFAHHLDVAHSEVEHEILVFIEQTAAIEVIGNLLSAATVGLAEAPTQDVEAGRVAAAIAKIVQIIAVAAADVREIASSLPLIEEISARVSSALDEGIEDIAALLGALPPRLEAVILVVLHRPWDRISHLGSMLARACAYPVVIAGDGRRFEPGTVYIGEPSQHLTLAVGDLAKLVDDPARDHGNRTVDLLFRSLVTHGGSRIIGVVLSGSLDDGSRGLALIHKADGLTMVLTPGALPRRGMPENAIAFDGPIDVIGDPLEIAAAIARAVEPARL